MAQYILKNKDINVLSFEVKQNEIIYQGVVSLQEDIVSLNIQNQALMPLNFNQANPISSLYKWIESRKIPTNRENADKILKNAHIKNNSLMAYIDVSLGLSLNDSFWIVPADKNYKWKDFNLYANTFDENLELVAFGIEVSHKSNNANSPEYTTNGMLKKCWHRIDKQIYLYKGSSKLYENPYEAYSEFYTAQIAKIMEFEYVPYDLKEFHGHIVSVCPIFTSENEGFMPMRYCIDKEKRNLRQVELIKELGCIYERHKLNDLMLFDALIYNVDRHWGNFGMITDNNTNELLRPSPIFDNGLSMITILEKKDLINIKEALSNLSSAFGFNFDEQLKLAVQTRHIPKLEKLTTFEFQRHKEFNLSDEWLKPIEAHIQERAKLAIKLCKAKELDIIAFKHKDLEKEVKYYQEHKNSLLPEAKKRIEDKIITLLSDLVQNDEKVSEKALNTFNVIVKARNDRKI